MAEIISRDGRRRKYLPGEVGQLEDGERMVVTLRDARGRPYVASFDASGAIRTFDAAQHRPGYRVSDAATAERQSGAYAARRVLLSQAWRHA